MLFTNLKNNYSANHKSFSWILSVVLSFIVFAAYACTTKVSEWTMQNYTPDDYQLIYFSNEKISEKIADKINQLKVRPEKVNIQIDTINTSNFKNRNENILYKLTNKSPESFWVLFYKNRLFDQYESIIDFQNFYKSPQRDKISNYLKQGNLCVLLYLETKNESINLKNKTIIEKYISSSKLGKIIKVVKLKRDDINEKMFIHLLLNVESDLTSLNEPMLFGIFGRFRVLEPLVGAGISEENINYLIQFLSADCSCVVKDGMPGIDMLYINEWENVSPALINKISNSQ